VAWNFGAGQWWRSPDSIIRLALQIDEAWPSRDRVPDGTAASSQHTATNPNSDHEPAVDPYGIVCAIDIAHSAGPDGADMGQVAEAIRLSEDPRVKYVIHAERMFSSYPKGLRYPAYTWRPYSGSNPHTSHMHLSVWGEPDLYDDGASWAIGEEMAIPEDTQTWITELHAELVKLGWNDGANSAKRLEYANRLRNGIAARTGVTGDNGAAMADALALLSEVAAGQNGVQVGETYTVTLGDLP